MSLTVERTALFSRMQELVVDLAQNRGIDVVFEWDSLELGGENPDLDAYEIEVRRILYHSEALDLTDDDVRLLECRTAEAGGNVAVSGARVH